MTPTDRCLRRIDSVCSLTDSSVVEHVGAALDELERAYPRASDRAVVLEAVYQVFAHRRSAKKLPFTRFVTSYVNKRQETLLRGHA